MSRNSWLATLVVIALAVPVAAQSGPIRFPLDFTTDPTSIGSCGTFDVVQTNYVTGAQLVWFDASGQPIKAITHLLTQVVFSNSVSGQTLSGFSNTEQTVDVVGSTVYQHGLAVSVDLPQRGTLFVQAGLISFNFATGEFRATPAFFKDFAPFCSALA